jgi:riboflavin kinase / FMN adenylyltransferase
MELIRGIYNLRPRHHGCVVTIGNFDGVHLGHQAVLGQLSEKSAEMGLPAVLVTFEPHPQEFFARDTVPPRLTRFREKIQALRRYAVDRVLCLTFDRQLAGMPAEDFISTVLINGLGVRYLVVGDDFRFGHQRKGDLAMLKDASMHHDFQVINMHPFNVDGVRVSSTRIRKALADGDLRGAEKLLGRSYRMSGRVVHGDQLGRTIGYPTANIYLHRRATPLMGVYAVEVFGLDKEPLQGVANIGMRPTVNGRTCLLEVHIFDFAQDIYGRHVQVEFVTKLRDEKRFESIDALRQEIQRDERNAREYFAKQPLSRNHRLSSASMIKQG